MACRRIIYDGHGNQYGARHVTPRRDLESEIARKLKINSPAAAFSSTGTVHTPRVHSVSFCLLFLFMSVKAYALAESPEGVRARGRGFVFCNTTAAAAAAARLSSRFCD